jgi:GT2 family glycosyltransferase
VIRRKLFIESGGFDEKDLPIAFNDVDLCLKVRALGFYNIYSPFVELYHYESASRGYEDTSEKQSRFNQQLRAFVRRHERHISKDPFYSPYYSLRDPYSIDLDDPLESRIDI